MRIAKYLRWSLPLVENAINVGLSKGDEGYIEIEVAHRFGERSLNVRRSLGIGGQVETIERGSRTKAGDAADAAIFWSILASKSFALDPDPLGLSDTFYISFECIGGTILLAHEIADEVLLMITKHGNLMQVVTRYDELPDRDSLYRDYYSYNFVVSMLGELNEPTLE